MDLRISPPVAKPFSVPLTTSTFKKNYALAVLPPFPLSLTQTFRFLHGFASNDETIGGQCHILSERFFPAVKILCFLKVYHSKVYFPKICFKCIFLSLQYRHFWLFSPSSTNTWFDSSASVISPERRKGKQLFFVVFCNSYFVYIFCVCRTPYSNTR